MKNCYKQKNFKVVVGDEEYPERLRSLGAHYYKHARPRGKYSCTHLRERNWGGESSKNGNVL